MATIKQEETIKHDPSADSTHSDSSRPTNHKVRTLPAFFMTPGIKSEISSTAVSTSSLPENMKIEPIPIDVEENQISTTYTLAAGEKPIATQNYDINIKPDPGDEQQLMNETAKNCVNGEDSGLKSEDDNVNGEALKKIVMLPEDNGNSLVRERSKTPELNSSFVDSSLSPCIADDDTGAPTSSNRNRVACVYGLSCYRLNAQHKAEFSHPGDADYGCDSTTDMSIDKPNCRYGSQCYRKNEEHRQKFNHPSSSTGRTKRKRTVRAGLQFDSDDSESLEDFSSDSDEYEPSFVVDDSSDDISNWETSENEDSARVGMLSSSEDENENNNKKKRKKGSKKK